MKKHFYTFPNGDINYHGIVNITDKGYIKKTPIEDYGDYLLLNDYVEPIKAFEMWLEHPINQ
ncbi:MAG: hypothetical protein J7L15_01085 [Clostridiales bacterium]|nr:hypothetical protein [Clostridiales bacterium]